MNFKYKIKEQKDNSFIIEFQGDLLGELAPSSLMEEISELISKGKHNAIIDLTKLGFINSSGIGILITILTKLRNKGGELILTNPSEKLNKLLAMTKLLAIFKIEKSIENANKLLTQ